MLADDLGTKLLEAADDECTSVIDARISVESIKQLMIALAPWKYGDALPTTSCKS